jgi:hypothetical protein
MTWWFHLLVRKVETLRSNAEVLERVVCSVGPFLYGERVVPLLLLWKEHTRTSRTVIQVYPFLMGNSGWKRKIHHRMYQTGEVYHYNARGRGLERASKAGVYESTWLRGEHVETRVFSIELFRTTAFYRRFFSAASL